MRNPWKNLNETPIKIKPQKKEFLWIFGLKKLKNQQQSKDDMSMIKIEPLPKLINPPINLLKHMYQELI